MKTRQIPLFARLISLVLAVCIVAIGTLSACGNSKESDVEMGRYVENELSAPSNLERMLATIYTTEGIVYYGIENNIVNRYLLSKSDDISGKEVEWLKNLTSDGGRVTNISESRSGVVYVIFSDSTGKMSLARSKDGTSYEIIEMSEWGNSNVFLNGMSSAGGATVAIGGEPAAPETDGIGVSDNADESPDSAEGGYVMNSAGAFDASEMENQLIPMGIIALDDGFLIKYGMNGIYQYSFDGSLVREYPGFIFGNLASVYDGILALADIDRQEINLYDLANGKNTKTLAYNDLSMNTYVGMDEKGVFLGDNAGILRPDNKGWELIVDGGLTSLIMPNLSIESLSSNEKGDYYAVLNNRDSYQFVRFTYDENIPSKPNTSLEVFSLSDNNTIRLAIGEFQRRNPNVRVNLRIGLDESSGATAEDVIRALNTELLAGKGPDVIVLDGLPIESYIEKGVLKDITKLANRLTTDTKIMDNLSNAYNNNGKIYGLPSRFILPVMLGDSELIKSMTSLSALIESVKTHLYDDPTILHAPDSLWEDGGMIMEYYEACVDSFTLSDGSINETALAKFLDDMSTLDSLLKEITPQSTSSTTLSVMIAGGGSSIGEQIDNGSQALKDNKSLIHMQKLSGMLGLMMISMNIGDVPTMNIEPMFNENKYYPQGGVGISASGKQQELAESFIEVLLSNAVQDKYLGVGFPVNGSSLQKMAEELSGETGEGSDMGLPELCKKLTNAVFIDQVIKDAVQSQIKGLLSGSITPEQAAAKVVEKTRLYLAE